jgi:hypothetical protein
MTTFLWISGIMLRSIIQLYANYWNGHDRNGHEVSLFWYDGVSLARRGLAFLLRVVKSQLD